MGITTDCIKSVAAAMGGVSAQPTHIAIGTGSSSFLSGNTVLDAETDRNALTSIDTSVIENVTYIADYSSTELSGTTVAEWGLFNAATGGSMFMKETIDSTVFDGDLELQIQSTLRFAISGT